MALYGGAANVFGDPGGTGDWTVFFCGRFAGRGPLAAIIIARIGRGRSIRAIPVILALIAPAITKVRSTIIGGPGIVFETARPGIVSGPVAGFDPPTCLLAITRAPPGGPLVSIPFLALRPASRRGASSPSR